MTVLKQYDGTGTVSDPNNWTTIFVGTGPTGPSSDVTSQSARSASAGLTPAARRAGHQLAAMPTSTSSSVEPAYDATSVGDTLKSSARSGVRRGERDDEADTDARADERRGFREHHPLQRAAGRAERQAHAELAASRGDRVADERQQSDRGERQRQKRKRGRQDGRELARGRPARDVACDTA